MGAWHFAQFQWNGTNLRIRIDGGAWTEVAAGNASFLTPGSVQIGYPYGGPTHARLDAKIAAIYAANTALSDADLDNLRAYLNYKFGLSI